MTPFTLSSPNPTAPSSGPGPTASLHPLDRTYTLREIAWNEAVKTALNQRHDAGCPLLTDKKFSNLFSLPNKCCKCNHNFDLAFHSPDLMILCCKAWVCETCIRKFTLSTGHVCSICRKDYHDLPTVVSVDRRRRQGQCWRQRQ